jgi:transmembrane sensor
MSQSAARIRRAATEASEWMARFDMGELSKDEALAFMRWLRESPIHVSEMLRIGRVTFDLVHFPGWGRIAHAANVSLNAVTRLDDNRLYSPPQSRERTRTFRYAAVAASLASIAIFSWVLWPQPSTMNIRTMSAERREITLPEGSIVQLAPETQLRIRLQPRLRSVMIERGKASFRVSKDPSRPFIVDAKSVRVRAVGTIFSVARNDESVIVTVAEGQVNVTPINATIVGSPDAVSTAGVSLKANDLVVISPRGIASPIRHLESAPITLWGDNRIIFDGRRVADVVDQFNRRNTAQILLTDKSLASRAVSGSFDANDPQSLVDFLHLAAGTVSHRDGDVIIVWSGTKGAEPLATAD